MKRSLHRCLVVLIGFQPIAWSSAQYVITDEVFLETLQYYVPNALTGNVLDTLHADVLACTTLLPSNFSASNDLCYNIDGIKYFVNLEILGLRYTAVESLADLPNTIRTIDLDYIEPSFDGVDRWPDSLRYLTLRHNWYWNGPNSGMYPLPPFPPFLEHLDLNGHGLAVDSLPPLPATLRYLDLFRCAFDTLPPLPNELRYLDAGHNTPLLHAPVLPDSLEFLNVSSSPVLDSLGLLPEGLVEFHAGYVPLLPPLPLLPSTLEIFEYGTSPVTDIPTLPAGLRELYLGGFANVDSLPALPVGLEVLHLGAIPGLTALEPFPAGLVDLHATNMNGLDALPALPSALEILNTQYTELDCYPYVPPSVTDWTITASCIPNLPPNLNAGSSAMGLPICTVISAPDCQTTEAATGTVFLDDNGNGVRDVGEPGMTGPQVEGSPGTWLAGVGQNGRYVLPLDSGTFTVDGTDMPWFIRTTTPHTVVLTMPFEVDSLNDIGYQPLPGTVDLQTTLSSTAPRPGFDHHVWIVATNNGTTVADGTVTFVHDPGVTWVGSTLPPTALGGNTAQWDFTNLVPGGLWSTYVTLHSDVSVPIGTPVFHYAVATPTVNDEDVADNVDELHLITVGSFDPNDKLVEPQSMDLPTLQSGALLEYTIRFQNTGTYPAERVVITDTLPSGLLAATLVFDASSHPCTWSLGEGMLIVIFDGIMLPDSASDEPGSHGFAQFTIAPDPLLTAGTQVLNTANIYFDFNEPVITEPCVFTVEISTGSTEAPVNSMLLSPMPVIERCSVTLPADVQGKVELTVLNAQGATVMHDQYDATGIVIDAGSWPAGPYVVLARTSTGSFTGRIVKVLSR